MNKKRVITIVIIILVVMAVLVGTGVIVYTQNEPIMGHTWHHYDIISPESFIDIYYFGLGTKTIDGATKLITWRKLGHKEYEIDGKRYLYNFGPNPPGVIPLVQILSGPDGDYF